MQEDHCPSSLLADCRPHNMESVFVAIIYCCLQVVSQILGESLDADEAADMIAFANEMAAASGDAIDFPAYVKLAKRVIN